MAKSTAREKRHARTKQAILDAAEEIIAELGTGGLSMRELANRIEYSPSGLYEYFSSKDEIITELCVEGFARLTLDIKHRTTGDTAMKRLVESGLAYLEFAMRHPQQYLIMFGGTPDIRISLEHVSQNSAYGLLKQIIAAGIDSHEFATHEGFGVEEITYQAWALLHGISMLRLTLFNKEGKDFDEFNRRVIETAAENLRTT